MEDINSFKQNWSVFLMAGEGNGEKKRIIRLGFLLPDNYIESEEKGLSDDDTIYVCLKNYHGKIGAEIFSHCPFSASADKIRRTETNGYHFSNEASYNSRPILVPPYKVLMERLESFNEKTEIVKAFKEDGLALLKKLEEKAQLIDEVGE